jgi:WD40 repeat protein
MFAVVFAVGAGGLGLWLGNGRRPKADYRIVSIAVSSSGRWIAAGTRTGAVTILDRDNPGSVRRIGAHSGELNDLRFSPDERLLAVANRNLSVYSVEGSLVQRALRSDGRNYGSVRFSPDARRLLTITGSATIELLNAESGKLQLKICCSTIYGETAFSPDGALIITAGHWPAVWNATSGKLIRRLTSDREFQTLRPIEFDPVHTWVLMGSQDSRIYAWNLRTGQRTATARGQSGYVDSIAVLEGSPWIAYSSAGGPVRLWNPENGIERLLGPKTTSNLVAGAQPYSLFIGTDNGLVEQWNIAEEKRSLKYDLR